MKPALKIWLALVSLCLALGHPRPAGAAEGIEVTTQDAASVPALTDTQVAAIKTIQVEAMQKAAPTAQQLASVVRRLYENNLSDSPDADVRRELDVQLKELLWQTLVVKGNATWAAFRVLTPAQQALVRAELAKPWKPGELPDVMDVMRKMFKLTQ